MVKLYMLAFVIGLNLFVDASTMSINDIQTWPKHMKFLEHNLRTKPFREGFFNVFGTKANDEGWMSIVSSFSKCKQVNLDKDFIYAFTMNSRTRAKTFHDKIIEMTTIFKEEEKKSRFCKYLQIFYKVAQAIPFLGRNGIMEAITPENVAEWAIDYHLRKGGSERSYATYVTGIKSRNSDALRTMYRNWFMGSKGIERAENIILYGDNGAIGLASKFVSDFGLGKVDTLPSVQILCDKLIFCYFEVRDMLQDQEDCDKDCQTGMLVTVSQLLQKDVSKLVIEDVKVFRRVLDKLSMISEDKNFRSATTLLVGLLIKSAASPSLALLVDIALSSLNNLGQIKELSTIRNYDTALPPREYVDFLRERLSGKMYHQDFISFLKDMPTSMSMKSINNLIASDMRSNTPSLYAYLNIESRKRVSISLVEKLESKFSSNCATLPECQKEVSEFFEEEFKILTETINSEKEIAVRFYEKRHLLNGDLAKAFHDCTLLITALDEAMEKATDLDVIGNLNFQIDDIAALIQKIIEVKEPIEADYQQRMNRVHSLERLLIPIE